MVEPEDFILTVQEEQFVMNAADGGTSRFVF